MSTVADFVLKLEGIFKFAPERELTFASSKCFKFDFKYLHLNYTENLIFI